MDFWRLFESPDKFLLAFDGSDAVFVEMDRDCYYRSLFCDQRIAARDRTVSRIACAELCDFRDRHFGGASDLRFIFHMAQCGSTLLARALDVRDENLVIREPLALRQLGVEAGATFCGGPAPAEWMRRLMLLTTLLGRSYHDSGSVIVKGNVPVNFMLPELLGVVAEPRAILIYLGLEDYLLAILRTPTHRQWVAHVSREVSRGIGVTTGVSDELTLPELAACLWLAQIVAFARVLDRFPGAASLDAEQLFGDPRRTLRRAADSVGQVVDDDEIDALVAGELFTRHSKKPELPFDNEARLARRAAVRREIGQELAEARRWLERQAERGVVPDRLPNPLIGDSPDLRAAG